MQSQNCKSNAGDSLMLIGQSVAKLYIERFSRHGVDYWEPKGHRERNFVIWGLCIRINLSDVVDLVGIVL